jgi:hypothetical protein
MLSSRTASSSSNNNNNNNNNNHRRQWSEGIMSTDKSNRLYKGRISLIIFVLFFEKIFFFKDDDRQLIQHLVNEYLLEGSNDVLDLIRNCPNECFEVKKQKTSNNKSYLYFKIKLGTC